jgi:hypothetical protein
VSDLGDQVGPGAVGPRRGVPEGDHETDEIAPGPDPDVAGGDEDLAFVGQAEDPFDLTGAIAIASVGVAGLPPVVPVEPSQR